MAGENRQRREKQREERKMGRERIRLEMDSLSRNEEFARVVAAVFMSRLNPTLEEVDDVRTAVSEAVTNAVIHGYNGGEGIISMELEADVEKAICERVDNGCGNLYVLVKYTALFGTRNVLKKLEEQK